MDPNDPGHSQDIDNALSVVLTDIFNQTHTEIDANTDHGSHHYDPLSPLPVHYPLKDDPERFEPLPVHYSVKEEPEIFEPLADPALMFINDILLEEDGLVVNNDPSFSYFELVAYQAKASELAAIVNEDSPTLNLDVSSQETAEASPSYPSSTEEVRLMYDINSVESETLNATYVPEYYRNNLLLCSLRGPQNQFALPDVTSMNCSYTGFSERRENDQSIVQERNEQVSCGADSGGSTHSRRHHKVSKKVNILKPRRDSAASRKKKKRNKEGTHEFVDINDLLLQCANAIGANNNKAAIEILTRVKQHASPHGNGAERLAYYFSEALDARLSGMGWSLYMGRVRQRPSSVEVLKATSKYMSTCPFAEASHYFINKTILNVAKNASVLHILELQLTGYPYPHLLKELASRPGGPPQVRLTGVGFPHYSMIPAQTDVVMDGLQKAGRYLSEYAAGLGVPFHYNAWAGPRDTLRMQDFVSPEREPGEVFVVISAYLLRYIMDDTLDPPPVRLKLLKMGRDINPDVYIQGIVTGSYSTPFFTRRFREALFHFESVYDMLDTFIERENTDRVVFESEILGKAILNIVACEGMDVVERVDKYKHWQALTEEVGFEQLPLDEEIKGKIRMTLERKHKEYTVAEDSQYLLMGWKGRMLHALSAWRASPPK